MGLFSFLKDAGSKLFGHKEAPAAAVVDPISAEVLQKQQSELLKGVVEGLHLPINNLGVSVVGDTVTVTGEADTQSTKEKAILALGNVHNIAIVDDQMTVLNPGPEAQFYEVKEGDSLSKIAKEFYGDMMQYPVIFEANKPMLTDVDLIYPGQVLRIPAI